MHTVGCTEKLVLRVSVSRVWCPVSQLLVMCFTAWVTGGLPEFNSIFVIISNVSYLKMKSKACMLEITLLPAFIGAVCL